MWFDVQAALAEIEGNTRSCVAHVAHVARPPGLKSGNAQIGRHGPDKAIPDTIEGLSDDNRDACEERAAILEFDAGFRVGLDGVGLLGLADDGDGAGGIRLQRDGVARGALAAVAQGEAQHGGVGVGGGQEGAHVAERGLDLVVERGGATSGTLEYVDIFQHALANVAIAVTLSEFLWILARRHADRILFRLVRLGGKRRENIVLPPLIAWQSEM